MALVTSRQVFALSVVLARFIGTLIDVTSAGGSVKSSWAQAFVRVISIQAGSAILARFRAAAFLADLTPLSSVTRFAHANEAPIIIHRQEHYRH